MTSRGSLISALVLRGELDAAEAELALIGPDEQFERIFGGGNVWSARGELRLAQGRPHEAVAAFERIGALCDRYGWRRYPRGTVTADHALALAGRRDEAAAMAETEVADARRRGVRRLKAAALVALGLAREGGDGIDALLAAVELEDGASGGALAALELGAALRRSGQRAEARTWLAQARDLTNREIAETLFVTRETVESQLGAAYSRLGIRSRAQLAEAPGGAG